jgi:hypothetical protein
MKATSETTTTIPQLIVLDDGVVQVSLGRAFQHAKHRSLSADGKEHENRQHAPIRKSSRRKKEKKKKRKKD